MATSRYQERILGCQFLFFIQYFFIFFKSSKKEVFKVSHTIMKFSLQVPKYCNWFKHFLAISCKIPWKFMSKIVWNFWNCLWFAEKMWEIWDFSNLSKAKFPKNCGSISPWKWRWLVLIIVLKVYFGTKLLVYNKECWKQNLFGVRSKYKKYWIHQNQMNEWKDDGEQKLVKSHHGALCTGWMQNFLQKS